MPKKDKYYELFEKKWSFKKISDKFKVKKETVYNHFMKYMFISDISHYEKFIQNELPKNKTIKTIIKMTKNGNKLVNIKYNLDEKISYEKIRLVQNLYKTNKLKRYMKVTEKNYNKINQSKKNINKEEIFGFLESNYQFRFKIAIGQYLSHKAIEWCNSGEMIKKQILNEIDRKSLARQYLKEDGYQRLERDNYKFKFQPEYEVIVEDIAKQIDYKIPKNYYLKKRDLNFGYEDHSITSKEYEGIHNTPGLKYKYIENYIRDELASNNKKINFIDFHKDIIPFIEKELKEYGYVFKKSKQKLGKIECLLIIYFLWHDEKHEEAVKYIQYE